MESCLSAAHLQRVGTQRRAKCSEQVYPCLARVRPKLGVSLKVSEMHQLQLNS